MPYPTISFAAALLAAFAAATLVGEVLARRGFPLPVQNGRMGCVDGLRGYLALAVLGHHYVIWMQVTRLGGTWGEPGLPVLNELGFGAVALFFMITGLVFYRRVLTGFRDTSWPAVYITRCFRILPLLVVSVLVILAIASTRTGQAPARADLVPLLRWFTAWGEPGIVGDADAGRINAYVLWSLRYEWLFYLFVLPAAAVASDLIRGRLPSLSIPLGLFVIAACAPALPVRLSLLPFLPLFAAGMLASEVSRRPGLAQRLRGRMASVVATAALALAASLFSSPLSWGLPAFVLFFVAVACGNSIFGLLRTRGALVLGEISFSLYLLHGIALSLFFTEGAAITASLTIEAVPVLLPVLAVVVTLVCSLTYLGIERPAMRLGSRLASRLTHLRIRSRAPEVEIAP